jgi:MFS transporter, DHA1 family, tetracycline resistance protein
VPSLPPAAPSRALALACVLLFGSMLNLTLVVAGLKELIVDELGGTVADAALFFTIEMAAYVLFGPIWGVLSDRSGRRRPFVVGGLAASGLLYFSFLAAGSIGTLLLLRFLQGAAAIAGWSTAMARVFDEGGESERPRRAGLAGAAIILGVGSGAPVGGWLSHAHGARAPLVVAGACFLLLALFALGLAEARERAARPSPRAILRALAARPRLLVPGALYLLERFTVGLFVVVFPLHLAELAGAGPATRGRYLALYLFPFAVGQLGTFRLVRRFGALPTLLVGAFAYGAALTLVGRLPAPALAGWMVVLGLLAAVIFPPTLALTAEWSTPETRASALGAFNLAGSLGFALGPVAGAAAARILGGYAAAFDLAGGVLVAGAAGVALFVRRFAERPAAPG